MTMTPSRKFELIHETLLAGDNVLNISELCEFAGVSRSGYYRWLNAEPVRIKRESQDRADFELILQAYRFRGYDKGIRGIHMRLLHLPQPVQMNVKKIQRLMRKYGLSNPQSQSLPPDGKGTENQQCGWESPESGVYGAWGQKRASHRYHIHSL